MIVTEIAQGHIYYLFQLGDINLWDLDLILCVSVCSLCLSFFGCRPLIIQFVTLNPRDTWNFCLIVRGVYEVHVCVSVRLSTHLGRVNY